MAEIKPCPFCGGKAEIVKILDIHAERYRFFATCLVCGVEMPRTAGTKEQAAKAWNRRAENG